MNITINKKIKKVLLIAPNGKITITNEGSRERKFAIPLLGIAYLASSLIKNGYDVEILDILIEGYENEVQLDENTIIYGLSDNEIKNRIKNASPDIIGISCIMSNRYDEVLNICKIAKEVFPDIPIIVGGHHPTGMPEMVLDKNIDYILRGESDNTIIQLIDSLNNQKKLSDIKGIVYKENKKYFQHPELDYIDFKSLPNPAWHLFNLKKYWKIGMCDYEVNEAGNIKFMTILTSKGCPHNCCYCTSSLMTGRKFRQREIDSVIKEIYEYKEKYNTERIYFWDDNFFINKNHAKDLLKALIVNFPGMRFEVINGAEANALDDEIIELLAKVGFKKVVLSIESLNEEIQNKFIDKKVNLKRIPSLVNKIHECGMIAESIFMVGFPGETKEQIDRTLELSKSFNLDRISISIVNPLPGTELYSYCVKNNLLYEDFAPHNIKWSLENIKLPGIERGYIAKRRREVWLEYMQSRIDIKKYELENTKL